MDTQPHSCSATPGGCEPPLPERRGLLKAFSILLGTAASAVAGVPIVGYLLSPVLRPKPDQWIPLGAVDDFPHDETRLVDFKDPLRRPWDGVTGRGAMYVRRLADDKFRVLGIHCTHLGCPVSWFPQSGLFLCPCHGGVYYEDGSHASGPPPRGLYQYVTKIEKGQLYVYAGHLPTLQDAEQTPPSETPARDRPTI